MHQYISPSRSIELKIQRHKTVIRSLVILVIVIIAVAITLVILARVAGVNDYKAIPVPWGGLLFIAFILPSLITTCIFLTRLQIVQKWASCSVTRYLQSISPVIIERTSQLQNAEFAGCTNWLVIAIITGEMLCK